jgi:hypothetical protein
MPATDLAHRSGLGIRSLALMAIAAVCLVLGGLAVYARATILDEDAFTARAVSTLSSDEVDEEIADRVTTRLVGQMPGLLRFQPILEYEARHMTAAPEFDGAFADAARRLQRSLFNGYTLASFDVGFAGAQLKATVAEREPRLREPLSRVDASDLMDLSGGGAEGALRHLAPTARRSAVAGVPALLLALVLLGAGILAAHDRRRGLHAAALFVGATGGAVVAGWTAARAFTLTLFDTSHGDAVVGTIWDAFLGDLRLWSLGLAAAGIVVAACVAATLPAGEPGRLLARARARLAGERLSGLLALGLLALAVVVLAARELVMDLFVVSLAGALLYRGVHQLARLAVR